MSDCCDPSGYQRFFNTKEAKRHARSYQQEGLDSTEGPMVEALSNSLEGKSLLDVGAGSGGATVELLRRGAGSAVAVDISDAYQPVVQILLEDAGVADQASFVVGDLVELDAKVGPADVVFGNRVICCYPDMPAMVDAMTSRANERLAASYPRDRWITARFSFPQSSSPFEEDPIPGQRPLARGDQGSCGARRLRADGFRKNPDLALAGVAAFR